MEPKAVSAGPISGQMIFDALVENCEAVYPPLGDGYTKVCVDGYIDCEGAAKLLNEMLGFGGAAGERTRG